MMWLMGLAGLVGAGAASFVVTKTDIETDEDTSSPENETDDFSDLNDGNILDTIDGLWNGAETEDAAQAYDESDDYLYDMFEEPLPDTGAVFAQETAAGREWMSTWPADEGPEPDLPEPVEGIADFADAPAPEAQPSVKLGDWIMQGTPSEPLDYTPGSDSLVVVWDDLADSAGEPRVGVAPDPYDPEVMHVTMNGSSVAEIYGEPALEAQDLTVIPLSSAMIAGLAPA
ncbi:hypothetical protein [Roseobacter ponti]|uniref:Uncharacterized protein n=1 Tax=Roseobacter ponti TaxID=1891787 RepID=A0A858SM25_9RHOB|nr:hypothetical protein [Roseobacter ponti]QJF49929.1 hypothetical protein G3256_01460 [Roseobacter ponti]